MALRGPPVCLQGFLQPFNQQGWRGNGFVVLDAKRGLRILSGDFVPFLWPDGGAWTPWEKQPDERGKVRARWAARPEGRLPSITVSVLGPCASRLLWETFWNSALFVVPSL